MSAAATVAREARSLDQADDEALLARIGRGDQAALGELYRRHRGTVRAYVLGRIARPDDAEDVVQETFLRAARKAGQYESEYGRSVSTWLRWQAGAQLREYSQHDLHPYLAAARAAREQQRRPVTETAEHREATALSEPVRAALDRLTPGERRAIQLRYLDGLSPEQAAAIIGVRERSFHRRVAYGRRKLARDLADLAPEARSPVQDMPRRDAYTLALAKTGDDVPAATTWLQRHGIRTSEDTLYRHRHQLQTGTAPVERPRPARATPPDRPAYTPPEHVTAVATARERARAAAIDYQARFGHLPTRREVMTATGVSESTAIRALRVVKTEPATAQPLPHSVDRITTAADVSPSLTRRQQSRDRRTGDVATAETTRAVVDELRRDMGRGAASGRDRDLVIEQARTAVAVLAAHRQLREQHRRDDEHARVEQLTRRHHDDAQQAAARARQEWGLAR